MNKKGFTLVELLVTIAISALVLSLGIILVNQIIENSKNKTMTVAHENIKKGANLYSKEFYDEINWINNQSCVSVEQLISKGYVGREKAEYVDFKYVIIEKDENNTIVSETNSDGVNDICDAVIKQTVSPPTSTDICNNLQYNGSNQNLIKENIGDIYKIDEKSIKQAKNAGSYMVTVGLKDGFNWKGNNLTGSEDENTKHVYCTIKKGIPDLKLLVNGEESYRQDAEQTKPVEVTITSEVPGPGTIEIKSSNDKYASVEISQNNDSPDDNSLELKDDKYTKKITVKNNANRNTNTYITITLKPKDQNYQSRSITYTIVR